MDDETSSRTSTWRSAAQSIVDRIKADNERVRSERNARRWKAERDPVEYERQKERQRQNYADGFGRSCDLAEQPVRSYQKIPAVTKEEHLEQAKSRDAARQKARYDSLTPAERQAESDAKADRRFVKLRLSKGIPEDEIKAQLVARIAEREVARAAKA
jgi:hypothetical protein